MAKYLVEVNYTLDGLRGLRKEGGTARQAAAQSAFEGVGGSIESFYYALGETDLYVIVDFPDNAAVAAAVMAVSAAGGVTTKTTALLSAAEIDAVVTRDIGYRPPGA